MAAESFVAFRVRPAGAFSAREEIGRVALDWRERRRARARLTVEGVGEVLLIDLPRPARLRHGDGLEVEGRGVVRVIAARELLIEIRAGATSLARLAFHLGNRHAPLEIGPDWLAAPREDALAALAQALGGTVRRIERAFEPEAGAFEGAPHE